MLAEHSHRLWGKNPDQSRELAEGIDKVAGVKIPAALEKREQYTEAILAELRKEARIKEEILGRLKIKFLEPYNRLQFGEIRTYWGDDLSQVKACIFQVFGSEVLTRLDLSLTD